jgi:hypothetical protein
MPFWRLRIGTEILSVILLEVNSGLKEARRDVRLCL